MFSTMSISLQPTTLLLLMNHLSATGATVDPAEAVDTAIRYWLAAVGEGGTGPAVDSPPRGYQWKSLFLPEGTWLRMTYDDDHQYAIVKGDHLMYRGRPVSPNQFACDQAGTVRNAWHDLSIRMPGEKNFKRAYLIRRELAQAPRASVTAATALPSSAPSHQAAQPGTTEPAVPPRATTPGVGWTEPERRKLRFRLEDVAFE